ncbi:hypothetical protein DL95DRAFT_399770 [Leptodontidium sp. 2 PMI_412]|nr:hypothetical protein DL95DRAFT_399770 [Leptodontidium sp. 2 PMI_412]
MSPSTTTQAAESKPGKPSSLRSVVWSIFQGFIGFALVLSTFYRGLNVQSVAISFCLSACTWVTYIEDGKKLARKEEGEKRGERRIVELGGKIGVLIATVGRLEEAMDRQEKQLERMREREREGEGEIKTSEVRGIEDEVNSEDEDEDEEYEIVLADADL